MSHPPSKRSDPAELEQRVAHWRQQGDHYTRAVLREIAQQRAQNSAEAIDLLLQLGAWSEARRVVLGWLLEWLAELPQTGRPDRQASVELWRCLADVSERSHDDQLLELFWQGLDRLQPARAPADVLPLLGVPVLNGADHLQQLVNSLDLPIETLAIVDQSGGRNDPESLRLRQLLQDLEAQGLTGVGQIRIARPFGNAGVAAAWNQILLSFPQASLALLVNHDVTFPPGLLAEALARLDPAQPQYLGLFPGERAFSAFALTALAWDAVGPFDERYYPAYCEDLDYRDRLLATPSVQRLDGSFAHTRMLQWNPQQSCTLTDDPALARANAASFQLNRLWYSYRQRGPCSRWVTSGLWRQRWLKQWD